MYFPDSKKHSIELKRTKDEKLTLQDLANAVAEKCGVPVDRQKLILSGM